ncbi:MAG: HipA family kinase [Chloroherpetonaceae bacterium]
MIIDYLHSISEPYLVYESGKRPVLITTNTTKDYVCKHNFGQLNTLFNEYIAVAFLSLWSVQIPKPCFITVSPDHINNFALANGLEPAWFRKSCFGSYHLHYGKELDDFFQFLNSATLAKFKKEDFLKIALFDIWVANEDRNAGHTNLLINPEGDNLLFYPIDHELIFNSNSGRELYQINENDTILAHDLFKLLFRKRGVQHKEIIAELLIDFEFNITKCNENIDLILSKIPNDWGLDIVQKRKFLTNNIFSETWIKETKKNFQLFYNKWIK